MSNQETQSATATPGTPVDEIPTERPKMTLNCGWLKLNGISHSFFSKSITLLSLTGFFLANFPAIGVYLGSADLRIKIVFVGALIFVIGHTVAILRAPPEFLGRTEATHIVAEMLVINGMEFYKGRRTMLEQLLKRLEVNPPREVSPALLVVTKQALAKTADIKATSPTTDAATIYDTDIQLRKFDRPYSRFVSFSLMILGSVLMFGPTALNVLKTLRDFIC